MRTLEILKERLSGRRNPNGYTILWNNETLPFGTTWSTGFYGYEIIPFEWGFQLIKENGRIAPPTQINFGKFSTENDFNECFERAMEFVSKISEKTEGIPSFVWGD